MAKTTQPEPDIATSYRGRFAPTPSGPLHLGSLLTALASWLQARVSRGAWLIRIDDLDGPRCVPGSADQILRQLEQHGLEWDEAPRYQSAHVQEYLGALELLKGDACLYPCICTRAELAQSSRSGPDGAVYPGTCRARAITSGRHTVRLRVGSERSCIDDSWQGLQCRNMETEIGDFVVLRADGVPGYQLASVVDEQALGITEVVRGADLLGSSIRQAYLFALMKLSAPGYRHLPVLVSPQGLKLSKQNHAPALQSSAASENLWRCLSCLQQEPPPELRRCPPGEILEWALAHWRPQAFAHRTSHALVD